MPPGASRLALAGDRPERARIGGCRGLEVDAGALGRGVRAVDQRDQAQAEFLPVERGKMHHGGEGTAGFEDKVVACPELPRARVPVRA